MLAAWLYLIGLPALTVQAVPPPAEQIGANCAAPVYASDRLVCDDVELRAIDTANVRASAAFASLPLANGSLIEANAPWFHRRSLCAFEGEHRACLLEAYGDRALILQGALASGGIGRRLRCQGEWSKRALQMTISGNGAILLADAGQLFAAATPQRPDAIWQPAVIYQQRGKRFAFEPRGKAAIICHSDS